MTAAVLADGSRIVLEGADATKQDLQIPERAILDALHDWVRKDIEKG
jgi:hypothetical protein